MKVTLFNPQSDLDPEGFEIQGLLGLNFLRRFNYEVRSEEGRILAERIPGRV